MKKSLLPDTQNIKDLRNIVINQVGIKDILHPISFVNKAQVVQPSVANFTMTVRLPANVKGTHMSRFIEILNANECSFSVESFMELVQTVAEKLDSSSARIVVDFPFFRNKSAPSSGVQSLLDYQATLIGSIVDGKADMSVKVVVPVTSLCPCSKSISEYGAHNQRSHITIEAKPSEGSVVFLEDLIDLAEQKASSELYAILKRDDEKVVTERAYENPAFVEDIVRDIAVELNADDKINYYSLESENFESIHNHSAYAVITNQK
ncbi:GTP cyclohydrolase FolE2 [Candidatus Pseudothioglobus sp. Uisw_016]|uniref:GTP cyclohydrolase FolE2 n=1 Tax=Candidatus Pseudothioglobus sp. Uisw_016 TaxID=3230995 RepID=UPI003A85DF14